MAIGFIAAGTGAGGTAAVTPGMPAGATTNDILILVIEGEGEDASADSPPTGGAWNTIGSVASSTDGAADRTRCSVYWAWYAADINRTVPDAGNHTIAQIYAFRGVNLTTPLDGVSPTSGSAENTTSHSAATGLSSTTNGAFVLCAYGHGDGSGTVPASWANTSLSSVGSAGYYEDDSGSDGTCGLIYGTKATAGVGGTFTWGTTASEENAWWAFVLKPAPAAQTGTPTTGESTGAAYDASVTPGGVTLTPTTAPSTGAAYDAVVSAGGVTLEATSASSSGTAYDATVSASITLEVSTATSVGAAYDAGETTTVTAEVATATSVGAAYDPDAEATGGGQSGVAGTAEAVGAAYDAAAIPGAATVEATTATSAGAAYDATVAAGAVTLGVGVAAATGASYDSAASPGAVSSEVSTAESTGVSYDSAATPGAVTSEVSTATSVGAAHDATAAPGATTQEISTATATGAANNATGIEANVPQTVECGTATSVGAAYSVGVLFAQIAECGTAQSTGAAYDATGVATPVVVPSSGGGGGSWRRASFREMPSRPRKTERKPKLKVARKPVVPRLDLRAPDPFPLFAVCGCATARGRAYGSRLTASIDWRAKRELEIEQDDEDVIMNLLMSV